MAKYLMVARDAGDWAELGQTLSPEQIQATIGRYTAWSERVAAQGKLLSGEKLRDGEGRVLEAERGNVRITDGPHTVSKEVIGGFWLLEAATYDEVVSLTKDHPHLEFGTLEIREIEAM